MALLEVQNIAVHFGGVKALNDVSISAEAGQITGVIGPNGAGKSTLLGTLSGLIRPKAGKVLLEGRNITRTVPHRRARLGMARTFQRLELWTSLTVEENVLASAEFARHRLGGQSPAEVAAECLERVGLSEHATQDVTELSSGRGRLLEVARALATRPSLLLLDEPSAGLNEVETLALGQTLAELAKEGMGIVMVEHHIELVSATCADVFVLDFGTLLAHGVPSDIRSSEVVQRAYLGGRHSVASA
jgi:branched-chain amino acid transport system ATP-binding protein